MTIEVSTDPGVDAMSVSKCEPEAVIVNIIIPLSLSLCMHLYYVCFLFCFFFLSPLFVCGSVSLTRLSWVPWFSLPGKGAVE